MWMLCLSSILVFLFHGVQSVEWKTTQKLNRFNLLSRCYGEQMMKDYALTVQKATDFCSQIPPPLFEASLAGNPVSSVDSNQIVDLKALRNNPGVHEKLGDSWSALWEPFLAQKRSKRQVGESPEDASADNRQQLIDEVSKYKENLETKMSNLTCVLTQLETVDSAGNINIDNYSFARLTQVLGNTMAGSDPIYARKLADGISDCYELSTNWPQQTLGESLLTAKQTGHMIFFECSKKVEDELCTNYQLNEWLSILYGATPSPGLMEDKYDGAAVAMKAIYASASEETKFVDDFFWQQSRL